MRNIGPGDLVHFHWPSFAYYDKRSMAKTWRRFLKFVLFIGFMRFRGASLAWTAHNLYPHDGGRKLLVHRIARRVVVALSSAIYVHGETASMIVAKEFQIPTKKLVNIDHGHWIDYYPKGVERDEARRNLQLNSSAFIYLFIGICKPYKNLENLIAAFTLQSLDTVLVIAGNFQSEAYLHQVKALAAEDKRIEIQPGFIPDDKLQCYLAAADCVVLPYAEILTSGAAMLALSFGKPVVVPALGSLVDVVSEDCGILYDPHATGSLARALEEVRGRTFDEDRIKNRANCFTWEKSARAMIDHAIAS
jgi:glycosyltransferase involved in cell wall biosynthesis